MMDHRTQNHKTRTRGEERMYEGLLLLLAGVCGHWFLREVNQLDSNYQTVDGLTF